MPSFNYTDEEVPQFELLKLGEYPFEVVGFDSGLSNKGRTNGCETATVKVRFFRDEKFDTPIAQWSERLTFPQTRDSDLNKFLSGILNMFVKCTNMQATVGEDLEINEDNCIGLRGIAKVKQEKRNDNGELTNRVDRWITTGKKFARVVKMDDFDSGETKPF